jgi:hypothetical protein
MIRGIDASGEDENSRKESKMKNFLVIAAFSFLAASASAQTAKPLKVKVVYDATDPSSTAVGALLVQQIGAQPKFFTLADGDDKDLGIVTDCFRATTNDPYSCFYVANEFIGSAQSLLGAAVMVQKSADEAAASLFRSILQDVVERWNKTNRLMLIGELESCLALTESSCAVPEPFVAELKTKSINLSQYLRQGGVKP